MEELRALKNSIFQALQGLPCPVYDSYLPEPVQLPACRYYIVGMRQYSTFEDSLALTAYVVGVDVFSANPVATEAENILELVKDKLDKATLSDGSMTFKARFLNASKTYDPDQKIWHLAAEFLVFRA